MTATLIDGKEISNNIKLEIRKEIIENGYQPNLAIILIGNDPSSALYVKLKEKACNEVGIILHKYILNEDVSQDKVIELIDFLNNDQSIDAILVQLPLPNHLNEEKIISQISKYKEVDGFSYANIKDFLNNTAIITPGLPNGIYELIKNTNQNLVNKKILVIANSEIFAKPIIKMMANYDADAKYILPDDENLIKKSKEADIIIIAVGRKWFLDKTMVKNNSTIIDVGINTVKDKVYGDVNPNVDEHINYRSPVPGGVGPMTIAMLLKNTLTLYNLNHSKK